MSRPTLPLALAGLLFLLPTTGTAQDAGAATQAGSSSGADLAPPRLDWNPNDPRIGLAAGWHDAESAISGLEHLASLQRGAAVALRRPLQPAGRRAPGDRAGHG